MTAAHAALPAAKSICRSAGVGRGSPRVEKATQLARLERQKTMLEKQLQVWRKQKQKTEERLATVEAQIAAVCESLTHSPAPQVRPETPAPTSQRPAFNYRY